MLVYEFVSVPERSCQADRPQRLCAGRCDCAGVVATVDRTATVQNASQTANQTRTRYGAGIIARQHVLAVHVAGYAAYVAAFTGNFCCIGRFRDSLVHISGDAANIVALTKTVTLCAT